MTYVTGVILISLCAAIRSGSANNAFFLKNYTDKICKNEPSCKLTNEPGIPHVKLTLEERDCMCDFECTEYNDCCLDSDFYKAPELNNFNRTYHCSPETRVYMVTSCAANYDDESVKKKCAKATSPLDSDNTAIVLPVTNLNERITYANAYCALCNNDPNYKLWNFTAECGELQSSERARPETSTPVASTKSSSLPPTTLAKLTSKGSFASSTPSSKVKNKPQISAPAFFLKTKTKEPLLEQNTEKQQHNVGFTGYTYPRNKIFNPFEPNETPSSLDPTSSVHNSAININLKIDTHNLKLAPPAPSLLSKSALFLKREKRASEPNYDRNKYSKDLDKILKNVKYDPNTKQLVSSYNNMDFVCKIGSKIPEQFEPHVRKCVPNLISTCAGNEAQNNLCQSYTAIVTDRTTNKLYRNKDCAICNGVPRDKLTGCPQGTRIASSGLFSADTKAAGGSACSDPKLVCKFCEENC